MNLIKYLEDLNGLWTGMSKIKTGDLVEFESTTTVLRQLKKYEILYFLVTDVNENREIRIKDHWGNRGGFWFNPLHFKKVPERRRKEVMAIMVDRAINK